MESYVVDEYELVMRREEGLREYITVRTAKGERETPGSKFLKLECI